MKRHVTFPRGRVGGELSFTISSPSPTSFPMHQPTFAVGGRASRRWPIVTEGDDWGGRRGSSPVPPSAGKWAGSPRAPCIGSQAGGAEEVNGAAGSAGTKRLDSSGARAHGLPRFPYGASVICPGRELTAGPCSPPRPFPAGGVPLLPWGFNLPLCPRLVGTQPPCLDRAQQAHPRSIQLREYSLEVRPLAGSPGVGCQGRRQHSKRKPEQTHTGGDLLADESFLSGLVEGWLELRGQQCLMKNWSLFSLVGNGSLHCVPAVPVPAVGESTFLDRGGRPCHPFH